MPNSPALSTASTADFTASSPVLPPLDSPQLPKRTRDILNTATPAGETRAGYQSAPWGSPYQESDHDLRRSQTSSSGPSEDSPIHRIDYQTPFLRPVPFPANHITSAINAAVLADRARQPLGDLTEDWIRRHNSEGNIGRRKEKQRGKSSGHSSMSGSVSGSEDHWLDERTPRARLFSDAVALSHRRRLSSIETLKASRPKSILRTGKHNMESPIEDLVSPVEGSASLVDAVPPSQPPMSLPPIDTVKADETPVNTSNPDKELPATPTRQTKKEPVTTPRLKKKLPWKGKNIWVLLPRDDQRGQAGQGRKPLTPRETERMWKSWDELGYDTRGFDLDTEQSNESTVAQRASQSRSQWPNEGDVRQEHAGRKFQVTFPNSQAWKDYVNELNEAKLRALGVSFGNDDPPLPAISPALSHHSRRASVQVYPALPFSPPIPTSSAMSAHGLQSYPFPSQSPGIPSITSPVSFNGRYNPRQSISIPASQSPFGFLPQQRQPSPHEMLQSMQSMHRASPSSPHSLETFQLQHAHQRHQSLQFPMLPHQQPFFQQQQQARASPRLQELREEDEEQEPSAAAPPPQAPRHNASDSLQREIDEAEYHLEEQFRSQLEHDQDYSPSDNKPQAEAQSAEKPQQEIKPFAPQKARFEGAVDNKTVMHHPRPHSRGHSLSQKYFGPEDIKAEETKAALHEPTVPEEDDAEADATVEESTKTDAVPLEDAKVAAQVPLPADEAVETDKAAAPAKADDHQAGRDRAVSSASNVFSDAGSAAASTRRPSHSSKPSLSKLNVAAPEFVFNPKSNFQPTQFNFGSNAYQPVASGTGLPGPSMGVAPMQFKPPAQVMNPVATTAPSFAFGSGADFSFASSGPKFRADAPSFMPSHNISDSVGSPPPSGAESVKTRNSSIFGNIDLTLASTLKSSKKSKAIPIVRPASAVKEAEEPALGEDADGRPTNDARSKRTRERRADDDDDLPRFATPTPEPESIAPASAPAEREEQQEKHTEDESQLADTAFSSTMVSETTDAKEITSPSEVSPNQSGINWSPFELNSAEVKDFNLARPFGEEQSSGRHTASLSATAPAFVPGALAVAVNVEDKEQTPVAEQKTPLDPAARLTPVEESAPATEVSPQRRLKARTPSPAPVPRHGSSGLLASRYADSPPKPKGLHASRFALTPSPELEARPAHQTEAQQASIAADQPLASIESNVGEATFEEIDALMQHMNEHDPTMGVKRTVEPPQWQPQQPALHDDDLSEATPDPDQDEPPSFFDPNDLFRAADTARQPLKSHLLENPFMDPPVSAGLSSRGVHRLQSGDSNPISDWEGTFSDAEQAKLDSRVNFFDGRVNDLVGGLLTARLGPLEKSLEGIQHALAAISSGSPMRERRSISAELAHSDADDEDDEIPAPRRSMSPRRDRRLEQMRAVVQEAFVNQQRNMPPPVPAKHEQTAEGMQSVLKAMEEMREQFTQSLHLDFRAEDLRNVVEDAVERRMPPTPPQPVVVEGQEELSDKFNDLQARYAELEQKHRLEVSKGDDHLIAKREAEENAIDLKRKLESAETKIEIEIMNKSAYDQRIHDLEDRLRTHDERQEAEVLSRRAAEDRLAEVQRLLRISSEEETRLRELVEEKEQKVKVAEANHGKGSMRLALLEAASANAQKTNSDLQNRVNMVEVELRGARQEAHHWRAEADRATKMHARQGDEMADVHKKNQHLNKVLDTFSTQLQENERIRESWRGKFLTLQEDMGRAHRELADDSARRIKKEQTMLARQDLLDAQLQAEAKTRERLQQEMDRLEQVERQGMRAVNESKRLEGILSEMRNENHKLQQNALRYQAEYEEARDTGAREVQRTKELLQGELDTANSKLEQAQADLEGRDSQHDSKLAELQREFDAYKANVDSENKDSSDAKIIEVTEKHEAEMQDLRAQHERQLHTAAEDAQRSEQNHVERLDIANSKADHLQDRVAHLEEELKIAKEAAQAAIQAVKASGSSVPTSTPLLAPVVEQRTEAVSKAMQLPEKISPQALRESIMVLQEQLQEREQKIEQLESTVSKLDPEAPAKISKRDDEISWLREVLAVRHSDLHDIITALGRDDHDPTRVRDAAIRLKANLQMEQQERERAMNGGSAISAGLSAIASTPRVQQAVGPLAAAWGSWRKGSFNNASPSAVPVHANGNSSRRPRPDRATSTPLRQPPQRGQSPASSQSSFLSGLLTPPASASQQPTAFSSTGRRFTAQDLANRPKARGSGPPAALRRDSDLASMGRGRSRQQVGLGKEMMPSTPPMMASQAYDSDAQVDDFDDAGFFDEE